MDSYCSLPFRGNFAIEISKINAVTKTGDKYFRTRFQVFLCKLKHLVNLLQPLRQSNRGISTTFVLNSVMAAWSHTVPFTLPIVRFWPEDDLPKR